MALLLLISLGTIIILACISVLTGKGSFTESSSYLENGTQSSWSYYNVSTGFYIDQFEGAIVILIIVIAIVVVVGLRFFNSGLSDPAVRTFTIIAFYVSLWGIFSVMAYDLIVSIAIFGAFIYICLTIIFIVGVFQTIHN